MVAVDWTPTSVLATATFTGITAVIAALGYQLGRTTAGRRKPIIIGPPRKVAGFRVESGGFRLSERSVWLYLFNQSDVPQSFTIDGELSFVLSPKFPAGQPHFNRRLIEFPANDGGNVSLWLTPPAEAWPDDIDPATGRTREPYKIRLTGQTRSGRSATWTGEARLRDPTWLAP